MRKKYLKRMQAVFLCFVLLTTLCAPISAYSAPKGISISVSQTSKTALKLKWSKKNVSSYKVYRASVDSKGKVGKYKRIATVSKKSTSYTDKKVQYKKNYKYRVDGVKSGVKYRGYAKVYSGIGKVEWNECLKSDTPVSPESITIGGFSNGETGGFEGATGCKPAGFVIYRSKGSLGWEKIAKIPSNGKYYFSYTDTSVTAGITYKYKVAAYAKLSGKTVLGAESTEIELSAVNQNGQFNIKVETPNSASVGEITFKISSSRNNGDIILTKNTYANLYTETASGASTDDFLIVSKYSYNGKDYFDAGSKDIFIRGGETVYLTMKKHDSTQFSAMLSEAKSVNLEFCQMAYNYLEAELKFDIKEGTGIAKTALEYYH